VSTLKITNVQHASASSANLVLASDGTVTGAALAGTSDVTGVNTTGTVTSGTTSLTVASATGITAGMYVVGEGITPGTTVSSISGTTVTLSANANATLSSDPVTFYAANKLLSPAVVGGMLCRAWVNFNGTSTVAIRASYNVSSITDNGTGDYTVNFTTALADANYVAVHPTTILSGSGAMLTVANYARQPNTEVTPTTTAYRFSSVNTSITAYDLANCYVAIFR